MSLETVLMNRHNKTSRGFTIHEEKRKLKGRERISNPKHPNYNPKYQTLLKLMVKGTTDVLSGGYTFMVKKNKKTAKHVCFAVRLNLPFALFANGFGMAQGRFK